MVNVSYSFIGYQLCLKTCVIEYNLNLLRRLAESCT